MLMRQWILKHTGNVVRTCSFQLRQLEDIRNRISLDTAKTLVNAFVVTRVDNCNNLLAGVPSCQLDSLQSVFNSAARLVCCGSRLGHITPLLIDELHWLRCRERITFKPCVMVYKSLHNEAPGYLQELCMPVNMNTRRSTLRSASDGQLIVPHTKTITGECAFSVAGPMHGTACSTIVVFIIFETTFNNTFIHLSFSSRCCKAPLKFLLTLRCYINCQIMPHLISSC